MPMLPADIARTVKALAEDAIAWNSSRGADRIKAMEYYDGVMKDTPSDDGRSSVVSRDFRAATKKVLPALMRTILGGDRIVEYGPVEEGDEEAASQATDYVNEITVPEADIVKAVHDATHDALRIRNGILKWWWDETITAKVTRHSGLAPEEFNQLAADDGVAVLEYSQGPDGLVSCKVKRITTIGKVAVSCIPNEQFFISSDAMDICDAVFVAHNQQFRRSQLVAMGLDRAFVADLPAYSGDTDQETEETTRKDDVSAEGKGSQVTKDMEEIDYWECFVRIDVDDDGISELRRICFAGGWNEENITHDEEWDDAPFSDIVIERRPHEWLGRSLFDDLHDIQRVKTVLTRNTLDNIYWQNNLQPIYQEGVITNPDAAANPQFGKPVKVAQGTDVRAALGYNTVPFIAKESFAMLGYMDDVLTDRTGISDASGGLPPDALQNVTAKASALFEQQSISQIEFMVRSVAVGVRRMFQGVLKLIIQHQDKPRMLRLRDAWVQMDPRSWNAAMDAKVNVGLGAGTRERDMMAMQVVAMLQEKLLAAFGALNNPYVTPDNLYNAAAKVIESAGLKTVGQYLTKPTPQQIEAFVQQKANQPDPEMMKMEGQMQLEQAKMEAARDKEMAQMQADVQVKQVELEKESIARREEMQANAVKMAQEQALEREKLQVQVGLKQMELAQQREIELIKLGLVDRPEGVVSEQTLQMQTVLQGLAIIPEMMAQMREEIRQFKEDARKPRQIIRDPATGKVAGAAIVEPTPQVVN